MQHSIILDWTYLDIWFINALWLIARATTIRIMLLEFSGFRKTYMRSRFESKQSHHVQQMHGFSQLHTMRNRSPQSTPMLTTHGGISGQKFPPSIFNVPQSCLRPQNHHPVNHKQNILRNPTSLLKINLIHLLAFNQIKSYT